MPIEQSLEQLCFELNRLAVIAEALCAKLPDPPFRSGRSVNSASAVVTTGGENGFPTSESPKPADTRVGPPSDDGAANLYAEASEAIMKLARLKGRESAVAVLSNFGATRLPDVPKDQLIGVKNAVFALLESPS